jgi:hypothetical protein
VRGLESLEVQRFIVGCPVLPAAEEDADPFEGQGAEGRMAAFAFRAEQAVVGQCPA